MKVAVNRAWTRRRFLRSAAQMMAALAAGGTIVTDALALQDKQSGLDVDPALAQFSRQYMQAKHAPGMTLGLVHSDRSTATGVFGLSDRAQNQPVRPEMLFEVGSISKSFCALSLLQMHEEGKLDLQRPVLEYLPTLPLETPHGAITVHHLLTHSSGLPRNARSFMIDPDVRPVQTFKPGTKFQYSNLGFLILGKLAETIDDRPYATVLQERILDPLSMTATQPAISIEVCRNEAQSYVTPHGDSRRGHDAALKIEPPHVVRTAAGCVASTAADMNRYMTMLLEHGNGAKKRVVSEESFALFTTPYIDAPGFGDHKEAYYGYGIGISTVDGHKVLHHTGGMTSFASSMQVDLDGGVAAFASINAMQGYRPTPVTKYALQVLRAAAEKKPVPAPEAIA